MKIKSSQIPPAILHAIRNPDLLEGEDIIIEDENEKIVGVIIQPNAYEFFLRKVSEREDEIDSDPALHEDYDPTAKTLDDLRGETK